MPKLKYKGKGEVAGFKNGDVKDVSAVSVPAEWLIRHYPDFSLIPDEPQKRPKKPEEQKKEQVAPAVPSLSAKKD